MKAGLQLLQYQTAARHYGGGAAGVVAVAVGVPDDELPAVQAPSDFVAAGGLDNPHRGNAGTELPNRDRVVLVSQERAAAAWVELVLVRRLRQRGAIRRRDHNSGRDAGSGNRWRHAHRGTTIAR